MKPSIKLILSIIVFIAQLLFYNWLKNAPRLVEEYYSRGIYLYIGKFMRTILGWIPFSVGDFLYVFGIIGILYWLLKKRSTLLPFSKLRFPNNWQTKPESVKTYLSVFITLNIVLLAFQILWGLNYYRLPLSVTLNTKSEYSINELQQTVNVYIEKSNKLHAQLQPVDSLPVKFTRDQDELFKIASTGFSNLKDTRLKNQMGPLSIKKSLITYPLTYMGYGGYLNPFTGEAQTNANINYFKAPVLILHEMSHQLGYAKENEANFIAIKAGLSHEDLYFQYSASIFALNYLLSDLAANDIEAFERSKEFVRPGILKNYKELRDFWKPYDGNLIEKISQSTYNQYLKANNQPEGMATYSYVVALLIE